MSLTCACLVCPKPRRLRQPTQCLCKNPPHPLRQAEACRKDAGGKPSRGTTLLSALQLMTARTLFNHGSGATFGGRRAGHLQHGGRLARSRRPSLKRPARLLSPISADNTPSIDPMRLRSQPKSQGAQRRRTRGACPFLRYCDDGTVSSVVGTRLISLSKAETVGLQCQRTLRKNGCLGVRLETEQSALQKTTLLAHAGRLVVKQNNIGLVRPTHKSSRRRSTSVSTGRTPESHSRCPKARPSTASPARLCCPTKGAHFRPAPRPGKPQSSPRKAQR